MTSVLPLVRPLYCAKYPQTKRFAWSLGWSGSAHTVPVQQGGKKRCSGRGNNEPNGQVRSCQRNQTIGRQIKYPDMRGGDASVLPHDALCTNLRVQVQVLIQTVVKAGTVPFQPLWYTASWG